MTEERHDFATARVRLEEIVTQVRKKDTSLEHSLDLLEEGVRLANICTELSDHTEWRTVIEEQESAAEADAEGADPAADSAQSSDSPDSEASEAAAEGEADTHSADDGEASEAREAL